jgi:hypothetical protein
MFPVENCNVAQKWHDVRPAMIIQAASLQESAPSEAPSSPPAPPQLQIPSDAICWTDARQHVGEIVTIRGSVVYTSASRGQPTRLNVGAAFPDQSRVTLVVWEEYHSNFPSLPEEMYLGRTILVTGKVYLRNGVSNIRVTSPSQIQILE